MQKQVALHGLGGGPGPSPWCGPSVVGPHAEPCMRSLPRSPRFPGGQEGVVNTSEGLGPRGLPGRPVPLGGQKDTRRQRGPGVGPNCQHWGESRVPGRVQVVGRSGVAGSAGTGRGCLGRELLRGTIMVDAGHPLVKLRARPRRRALRALGEERSDCDRRALRGRRAPGGRGGLYAPSPLPW